MDSLQTLQSFEYNKHFKHPLVQKRLSRCSPRLLEVMVDCISWAVNRGLSAIVTESFTLPDEDLAVNRKHKSHQQGRAFDLRNYDWPKYQQIEFERYLEVKYGDVGAFQASTGKRNLVENHDSGSGQHFHIQLDTTFSTVSLS